MPLPLPRSGRELAGSLSPGGGSPEVVDKAEARGAGRPLALADQPAAEADGDCVRAAAGLQLREQVADVRLDRLLREEEALADLAVDEAVTDQLEDLDLAVRRLLLELPQGSLERDDVGAPATAAAASGGDRLEATRVVQVPAKDLFPFRSVHG
jgi:hypothetical protein